MLIVLQLSLASLLIAVFVEDIKERAVRVWYFPLLLVLLFLFSLQIQSLQASLLNLGINFLMLGIILLALWGYINLKDKSISFFQGIGAGDLFFFLCLAIAFSSLNFILFLVLSQTVALLIHLLCRRFRFYGNPLQIPLAGIQALLLALIMASGLCGLTINTYTDWIVL